MPTFIFYPLLVALLGLGKAPLVVLGVLSAAPAVMISTLSGLDGVAPVLMKLARVHRLSPARTLWWIVLPAALPRLFSGFKLALSYALIGVIAGEFILSGTGLGYAISFAYQSFDNRAMYGLMLFVLLVAVTANGILYVWEGRLARRRSRDERALVRRRTVRQAVARRRIRAFDAIVLTLLMLALWQAIGSWTHGVAVSPPLQTLVYLVRSRSARRCSGNMPPRRWRRSCWPSCSRR